LGGAHTGPVHDPVAAVVHSARASDVALTVVRGRILHRNGTCLTIDAAAALRAVQAVADRIRPIVDARHLTLEEPRGE
jgi:5-methylthioadenosine/S-adenosylhomocysteine deaminase